MRNQAGHHGLRRDEARRGEDVVGDRKYLNWENVGNMIKVCYVHV